MCTPTPGAASRQPIFAPRTRLPVGAWLLWSMLMPAGALAEPDLERFDPPVGAVVTPRVADPRMPHHGTVMVGLWASHAHGVAKPSDQGLQLEVSELSVARLGVSVAAWERISLGVSMPFGLARVSEGDDPRFAWKPGLGDLTLQVLLPLHSGELVSLGFLNRVGFPTASADLPLGEAGVTWGSDAIIAVTPGAGVTLVGRMGFFLRPRYRWALPSGDAAADAYQLDDEARLALGMSHTITRSLSWYLEATARLGVGGRRVQVPEHVVDGLVGARWSPTPGWELDLGVGSAAWPTPRGYGSEDIRAVLGVRVRWPGCVAPDCDAGVRDADGDGVDDAQDVCPLLPEDRDGFFDGDGCPDLDDDADGLADDLDGCPRESEDRDGFQDADGCPDPDNDGDGILDERDECPTAPQAPDATADAAGCPP